VVEFGPRTVRVDGCHVGVQLLGRDLFGTRLVLRRERQNEHFKSAQVFMVVQLRWGVVTLGPTADRTDHAAAFLV
jgi:hypothetical protein